MSRGHRQLDHTADVALELWAPSLEALFEEGAIAIIDVLTEGRTIAPVASRTATLEITDPEDGLVVWLNEVLYWAVTGGFLFARGRITLEEGTLRVEAEGQDDAFDLIATELKSVTYHHLLLEEREDGWLGRVVVDV